MLTVHWGTTRLVVVCGGIAVKFPRGSEGVDSNLREGRRWQRHREHSTRGQHLCPVLWCDPNGAVLIMPAAEPVAVDRKPHNEIERLYKNGWWDYGGPSDEGDPTEYKSQDWGIFEGRLVAVDYGLP